MPELWSLVEEKLVEDWSPQQISSRLKLELCETNPNLRVPSHERIYLHVYEDKKRGGSLYKHLRCQKKRRKRYGSGRNKRGQIVNMTPIEQRTSGAHNRSRAGHFEADLVLGTQGTGAFLTLVDRKTRYTCIEKVAGKTASEVTEAMMNALSRLPEAQRKSVTFDRGKEFAMHETLSKALNLKTYFANPYRSCERGTNENTNGLIRQFAPKKTSFKKLTKEDAKRIQDKLNNRPRRILGYRTPNEVQTKTKQRLIALGT